MRALDFDFLPPHAFQKNVGDSAGENPVNDFGKPSYFKRCFQSENGEVKIAKVKDDSRYLDVERSARSARATHGTDADNGKREG